jgi:hypothetical protein
MTFEQVGGVEYLVQLAHEDPKPFVSPSRLGSGIVICNASGSRSSPITSAQFTPTGKPAWCRKDFFGALAVNTLKDVGINELNVTLL